MNISQSEVDKLAETYVRSRANLLSIVYHHQGGSSAIGQTARQALGIGKYASLTSGQAAIAREFDANFSKREPPNEQ